MVPLSHTYLRSLHKWQISLPFYIRALQFPEPLPFQYLKPEKDPFRVEPLHVGHYGEYSSPHQAPPLSLTNNIAEYLPTPYQEVKK